MAKTIKYKELFLEALKHLTKEQVKLIIKAIETKASTMPVNDRADELIKENYLYQIEWLRKYYETI